MGGSEMGAAEPHQGARAQHQGIRNQSLPQQGQHGYQRMRAVGIRHRDFGLVLFQRMAAAGAAAAGLEQSAAAAHGDGHRRRGQGGDPGRQIERRVARRLGARVQRVQR